MDIILASASLRRQELLNRITSDFKTVVSNFNEESVRYNGNAKDYVVELSRGKALGVSKEVDSNSIIIGADTIVFFQGTILGKPKSDEDAFFMLSALSGSWHEVYTGITIFNNKENRYLSDYVCTRVKFSKLSDTEIREYIKSGDHKDKAGSYGIQGAAALFVEEINGCYYNVVGLPLNKLSRMLKSFV